VLVLVYLNRSHRSCTKDMSAMKPGCADPARAHHRIAAETVVVETLLSREQKVTMMLGRSLHVQAIANGSGSASSTLSRKMGRCAGCTRLFIHGH
jgi:hypothetical protein